MDATIEAGEMRLRPIIMTSLAFVLGVLPLAVATGVGANSRHSIGTGIIGGMLGETTLAMLYVPLFFYLFESLSEKLRDRKKGARAGGRGRRASAAPRPQEGTDMRRLAVAMRRLPARRLHAGAQLPPPGRGRAAVLSLRDGRSPGRGRTPRGGTSSRTRSSTSSSPPPSPTT